MQPPTHGPASRSPLYDEWVLIKADRVMKLKVRPMASNCSSCSITAHISAPSPSVLQHCLTSPLP